MSAPFDGYELGHPPGRDALVAALTSTPPRLDLAALAVARLLDPGLDEAPTLARLDALGAAVLARKGQGDAQALVSVLFDDEGYTGEDEDYHAPENSSLPHVLARRQGLPILLSLLYMEVGRRAGLRVDGLGLPGHFVVRVGNLVLDPFHHGRVLSLDDCREIVTRLAPMVTFSEDLLAPVSAHAMLWRLVNNLKNTWLKREALSQALAAVDLLLTLTPGHPNEVRLRARLLRGLGAYRAALADLELCIQQRPEPSVLKVLVAEAEGLRKQIGLLH
jgi:regulator of sirC expression with transglutaminase-like and TPR domain